MVLRELGRTEETDTLVRRGLDVRRRARGAVHEEVAQSLRNLDLLLLDRRAFTEAESAFEEAVSIGSEVYPPDHPRRAELLVGQGRLFLEWNRTAKAESVLREALEMRRSKLGVERPATAEAEALVGVGLARQDERDRARPLLQHASVWFRDHPPHSRDERSVFRMLEATAR